MNDERQGGFEEIANPYIVGNPVREPTGAVRDNMFCLKEDPRLRLFEA